MSNVTTLIASTTSEASHSGNAINYPPSVPQLFCICIRRRRIADELLQPIGDTTYYSDQKFLANWACPRNRPADIMSAQGVPEADLTDKRPFLLLESFFLPYTARQLKLPAHQQVPPNSNLFFEKQPQSRIWRSLRCAKRKKRRMGRKRIMWCS